MALVDPIEALPNRDLLPLCSTREQVSRSCVALGGRLSRASELALPSPGLVLR